MSSQPSHVYAKERRCNFRLGPLAFDCGVSKNRAHELSLRKENLPGDVCLKNKYPSFGEAKESKEIHLRSMQCLPRSLSLHDPDPRAKLTARGMLPSTRALAARESCPRSLNCHPVLAAWAEGRTLEACRELRKLEDAGEKLDWMDKVVAERIHRVAARYEQALGERTICGDWVVDHDSFENIRIAYRAGSTLYQTAITIDFDGEDPLMAFAALCEFDLSMGCDLNCESIQQLNEEPCHPLDSVWRMQRAGQFGREDNIRQLSCVDALDEPDAALWVSMYPPQPENAKQLRSLRLPPASSGCTRNMHSKINFFIEPVRSVGGGFLPGFRLIYTTCTRPSLVIQKFLSVTPRRIMIRQLREKAMQLRKSLRDRMGSSAKIQNRLSNGPRAGFYISVAKHFSSIEQKTSGVSPQLESACLPPVAEEAHHGEENGMVGVWREHGDSMTEPQNICIDDVKTLADLSMHVASNWAD